MSKISSIAVDVMGSDLGISPIIFACIKFAQSYPEVRLVLVGDQSQIQPFLNGLNLANLEVFDAPDVIQMQDIPTRVVRRNLAYSMRACLQQVALRRCDVGVTCANTGALVLLAKRVLGLLDGILRPALSVLVPTLQNSCVLLDVGATVDCSALHLQQFAHLGLSLTDKNLAKVGLLNIGVEANKGNAQVKEAAKLLEQDKSLNFVGFIESDGVYRNLADVVVCDGFAGNLFLKTSAAAVNFVAQKLNYDLPSFVQPNNYNLAILLGVNGLVVKAHGASCAISFYAALENILRLKPIF